MGKLLEFKKSKKQEEMFQCIAWFDLVKGRCWPTGLPYLWALSAHI